MGLSGGAADARFEGVEMTAADSAGKFLAISGRADLLDVTALDPSPEEVMGSRNRGGWLKLDLSVKVHRPEGMVLLPTDFFGVIRGQGQFLRPTFFIWGEANETTNAHTVQWVPFGDSRRIRIAWRIGEDERENLFFRYSGAKEYRLFSLGLGEGESEGEDPLADRPEFSEMGRRVWFPELEPQGIAGVGLNPNQVNEAIDKGKAFLLEELKAQYVRRDRLSGRSYMIIALYALVNTDAHKADAVFDELLREYLRAVNPTDYNIYEVGLLAMILRAYGDPAFYGKLEELTRYMVEAQGENGTWHYVSPVPSELFAGPEGEEDASAGPFEISGGAAPIEVDEIPGEDGMYRTLSFTIGRDGDNSCTQFAVLGLWSAQRAGLEADPDVWARTLRSASTFQNLGTGDSFGGFAYRASGLAYGSMTAAVLCTTAIALRQLDADVDVGRHPRIRNTLGWLIENFDVTENPTTRRYNYYYLYSLERVGQILGSEFIGEHEWYPLGAKHLVETQSDNGSWPGRPGETNSLLTTSYALLFLLRATPQMDEELVPEPEPEGPGRLVTTFTSPPPPPRLYLILDASGSMRAPIEGEMKFDIARDAVRDLVEVLPEGVEFALRVYGHRYNALHDDANVDSALELPFAQLDRGLIHEALDRLRPVGRTPLAYSLDEALKDVGRGRGRGRETLVLLLTDGGDDTRSNPVASAQAYAGLEDVQFHILGFDINRPISASSCRHSARSRGSAPVSNRHPSRRG